MEPRPKDKMPENPLEPLVRAVVWNAIAAFTTAEISSATARSLTDDITRRLCEQIDQDGWDHSDRIRRAATKLTWGADE